ncbi:hypothetical protein [Anaerotignum propionicum]|uniref:Chromosome partition protein Smc n=1 Tax=Anaerotignum propionicum DSM 1682 TaxID=991789 RepID=A0A0X8VE08_ANAPI|nr:hypothetical protein [Anaerotignum propionicum]AMJ41967.1 hypothetical protein CPRO_24010 [Anaerotignum propionicum DSM 1682]SHE93838.1 hypothetical protein SAMN02745151_02256 [[Clostridium] propionicum DSM 1682] [Anaerotignum propionicum DSM 1682]
MKSVGDKMELQDIKEILDKLEKVNGQKATKDIIKIIFTIAVSFITVIITALICLVIYKNSLSTESVLSILLAFFSIFISIFFYFKADETSNKFYDSSYNFMKDQSNVLGRIEERFGEKFESLISRFDHLETKKISTEEKIDVTQDEISMTLNEAIAQLSQENEITKEKLETYKTRLEQKNSEYKKLRNDLSEIKSESQNMRSYIFMNNFSENLEKFMLSLSPKDIKYFLNNDKLQNTNRTYRYALEYGLCDEDGIVVPEIKKYIQRKLLNRSNYRNISDNYYNRFS